jgi:orotate phosphoribosyltransferase
MLAYSGYGDWKYERYKLNRKIEQMKRLVPMLMARHHCDGVVLHGSSGVWMGAALVMNSVLPEGTGLFLVRKPGEQSHGDIVEGDGKTECTKLLMIDDFVSTGASVARVQDLIIDNKVRPAYIEAVLQHDRMSLSRDYTTGQPHKHNAGQYMIY